MATLITKNSSTASAAPLAADLTQGELAVNVTDKKLYSKDSGGAVVKLVGGLGNQEANAVAITGGTINGATVGATTASTGAFTTLSASSTVSGTGFSTYLASPPAIGGTAAAAVSATTLAASGAVTLSGGTANGVTYLNGSKVLTSGSNLTTDGTNLALGGTASAFGSGVSTLTLKGTSGATKVGTVYFKDTSSADAGAIFLQDDATYGFTSWNAMATGNFFRWAIGALGSEQMRLTSTGLGIGTSSPAYKLDVQGGASSFATSGGYQFYWQRTGISKQFGFSSDASGTYLNNVTDSVTGILQITNAGNLGLGVTPSAWNSAYKVLQFSSSGGLYGTTGNVYLGNNVYSNSADSNTYITTNFASMYRQVDGKHLWYTAASGTAGNAITFTQAMTLDASGNLGVGTTSPQLKFVVSNAGAQGFEVNPNSGIVSGGIDILCYNRSAAAYKPIYNNAEYHVWATSTSERARIASSGELLVATTSVYGVGVTIYTPDSGGSYSTATSTAARNHWRFANANGAVGSIQTSGSATSYNTSSDHRLKNTIAPMTGALAKVALLKPCTYKWNADGSNGEGFIAHELAEVVPQCVTGEKDGTDVDGKPQYQGIDTSFLVATLTAALQELNAKFNAYVASHP